MEAVIGIYAGMGLLVILICVPMILEMVPPNNWYGFRTRRTLSDPNVWYPANRIAGQYLAVAGTVIVLTTLLVFLFQKELTAKHRFDYSFVGFVGFDSWRYRVVPDRLATDLIAGRDR